ncbi:ABC-type transport auxiliary lipoprotein family protein [Chelativorans composti]|uniref:ABC-type transport auxiliary lipoprotein family protein n=1 Tax=Chelativorans composti TaxID=768533 RepID=UPI0013EA996E|nr:ABC transporter [bacterium SGD-2]
MRLTKLLVPGTLAASLLQGCAVIGLGPAPVDAFDITAPREVTAVRRYPRTQILVPQPTAIQILDGQDIAVRVGSSLQLLKGARWADRLPVLVQSRVIEAFQRSGSFGGVGRPGEGLAIDYQVSIDIRSFEISVEGGRQVARVDLFVRILNDRNGVVRASRDFRAVAPVGGEGSAGLVEALNRAFQQTAAEIVTWTTSSI